MSTFDSTQLPLSGWYCERCGRQVLRPIEDRTCFACGGELFRWRPPRRQKRRESVATLDELTTSRTAPSAKQAALLIRYGYAPSGMTRQEASQLIGKLAANGWRQLGKVNQ
jgi:hypothetical protein